MQACVDKQRKYFEDKKPEDSEEVSNIEFTLSRFPSWPHFWNTLSFPLFDLLFDLDSISKSDQDLSQHPFHLLTQLALSWVPPNPPGSNSSSSSDMSLEFTGSTILASCTPGGTRVSKRCTHGSPLSRVYTRVGRGS